MELRDLLRVLRRRLWVLLGVFIIAAGSMGSGLIYSRTPVFKAEATILFKPSPIEAGVYVTPEYPAAPLTVKSRIALMKGDKVMKMASEKCGVDPDSLLRLIDIQQGVEESTVTITVTDLDRENARKARDALLSAYEEFDRQQVTGRLDDAERRLKKFKTVNGEDVATETPDILRDQADKAQRDADAARAEAEARGIVDLDLQIRLLSDQVAGSMRQQSEAEFDMERTERRVKSIEERAHAGAVDQALLHQPVPVVPPAEYVSEAKPLVQKLTELKSRLAKFERVYKDEYKKVGELRDEIASVEAEIRDLSGGDQPEQLRLAKAERSLADTNAKFASALVRKQYSGLTEIQKIQKRAKDGDGRAEKLRADAKTLEERFESINAQRGLAVNALIERLRAPDPYLARKAVEISTFLVIGLVSLLISFGFIYLLEYVNDTIRTVADVKTYLNLPTLGIIPVIKGEPTSLMEAAIKSPTFEDFNKVATFIEATVGESNRKILAITSAKAEEGKTTICANLAIALARGGQRVAVIDADMRKGQMHMIFGLDNARGLSNVLAGELAAEARLAEATGGGAAPSMKGVLQATKVENLFVLPCGPVPVNPIGLLRGPRAKELFEGLEKDPSLDLVLIDTPPLLGVVDAAVITSQNIPVVMLVEDGAVRRAEVTHVKAALMRVAAKILGVVINKAKIEPETYHYYYYRYRGYSS